MMHTPCPTAPEHLWLQVDPEPEEAGKPIYPEAPAKDDVTWCVDRINDSDTLYLRADLVDADLTRVRGVRNNGAEDMRREIAQLRDFVSIFHCHGGKLAEHFGAEAVELHNACALNRLPIPIAGT